MEANYNLRSLNIGDYYSPPLDLRPWFFTINSSLRLQALLDLESPPTLHPALITAHCINSSLKIICGAPPTVKTVGDVYFPTSAAEVSALENSVVGFFKVQDVDLVIDRGEGREEIGGRAIVFQGGTKQLKSMIAEARRDRALWEAKWTDLGDRICAWAEAVEEGDWKEVEVVWEQLGSRVEKRRTWG
jgi:hypothetical protein